MEKKKIKIAFFTDVLKQNLDGVTYTLYNIIERIPDDRFEFIFITPYPPDNPEDFPYPVVVCRYIQLPFYKMYPLAFPYYDRNIKRALEEFEPDLIHFTTPSFLGHYAVKYAKRNNIPVLSTFHTHFMAYIEYYFKYLPLSSFLLKKLAWKFARWFYNSCEKVFVPTQPIIDELAESGVEEKRMMIWGRGIDSERFSPSLDDPEYMDKLCGQGTKRILFVSRIVWEKEIRTLLRIYRKFHKTRPDIKMVITGDGPQLAFMQRHMPEAVFTGKLINGDLSRIYASSDIFVFPSITETFGNVVLEAMASGLPVVAAAKGGPKGIVKDGITGFHAVPRDENDFCEKIIRLVDDGELYRKMKEEGVAYAATQQWDTLCKNLFQTYEEVLNVSCEEIDELSMVAI